jgi:hypothetical protein
MQRLRGHAYQPGVAPQAGLPGLEHSVDGHRRALQQEEGNVMMTEGMALATLVIWVIAALGMITFGLMLTNWGVKLATVGVRYLARRKAARQITTN